MRIWRGLMQARDAILEMAFAEKILEYSGNKMAIYYPHPPKNKTSRSTS